MGGSPQKRTQLYYGFDCDFGLYLVLLRRTAETVTHLYSRTAGTLLMIS